MRNIVVLCAAEFVEKFAMLKAGYFQISTILQQC